MQHLDRVGTARVAVFVDGDNLPPAHAGAILAAGLELGRADLRRVYAAEAGCRAWDDAPGFRLTRVPGSKNGTDLLLCIEAVETACRGGFDGFVIASDDRDFSHLAHWLRERGHDVLGVGTAKSPAAWREACSRFLVLAADAPPPPAEPLGEIDALLRTLLRGRGAQPFVDVGNAVSKAGHPRPAGGWRDHLAARPALYDLDPKGPGARVRWIGP